MFKAPRADGGGRGFRSAAAEIRNEFGKLSSVEGERRSGADACGREEMHWEQLLRARHAKMERAEALAQAAEAPVSCADEALDPQRRRVLVSQLQQKILKLTEQLRIEQAARDDNVAEYLKLASNASDKQQSSRIKQVFEKKNQKAAASIAHLQRKLEAQHRRLREAETSGAPRQHRARLRELRGVFTGLSEGVVDSLTSKPREIASLLRTRFGSADNISGEEDDTHSHSHTRLRSSPSDEDCSSATSGSNSLTGAPGGPPSSGPHTLERSGGGLELLMQELSDVREEQSRLQEELDTLRSSCMEESRAAADALQEERFRCERLEEQVNDLTELHQNEILNLKQELASMEEKIAYQSNERARDLQEALEACQTRVSKMELAQQQQVCQLEAGAARTLVGKLMSVLLAVAAVLLVLVSAVSSCVLPLMKTRGRSVSSLLLGLLLAVLWRNWDSFSGHTHRVLHTHT